MKFTYLLINVFTIVFPIVLSFDNKVQFYRNWKFIFPGLLITGAIFLVWDYIFTIYNVWSFNPDYVVGLYFLNLPIEEILFFITVPFSCIFIYECLRHYIKTDILKSISKYITIALLSLSAMIIIVYHHKVYTLITFSILPLVLIYAAFLKWFVLSRFYLAFLVCLIPFFIVNGILTSIPIVMYNNEENMGLRVGSIPAEDLFYLMALLLMNILFFEYFKSRKKANS